MCCLDRMFSIVVTILQLPLPCAAWRGLSSPLPRQNPFPTSYSTRFRTSRGRKVPPTSLAPPGSLHQTDERGLGCLGMNVGTDYDCHYMSLTSLKNLVRNMIWHWTQKHTEMYLLCLMVYSIVSLYVGGDMWRENDDLIILTGITITESLLWSLIHHQHSHVMSFYSPLILLWVLASLAFLFFPFNTPCL